VGRHRSITGAGPGHWLPSVVAAPPGCSTIAAPRAFSAATTAAEGSTDTWRPDRGPEDRRTCSRTAWTSPQTFTHGIPASEGPWGRPWARHRRPRDRRGGRWSGCGIPRLLPSAPRGLFARSRDVADHT